MREWLTVIIACLIIGILLDGLRRMRAAKRSEMKMSLSMHKGTNKDDLAAYGSELPNGGARVVAKRDAGSLKAADVVNAKAKAKTEPKISEKNTVPKPAKAKPVPPPVRQVELDLDQHVPLLMDVDVDPVALPLDEFRDDGGRREPSFVENTSAAKNIEAIKSSDELADEDDGSSEQDAYDKVLFSGRKAAAQASPVAQSASVSVTESLPIESTDIAPASGYDHSEAFDAAGLTDADIDDESDEGSAPDEVFVVNVMAPKGEVFVGEAIKDAILGAGMRYGSRKIFHKHEGQGGEGAIQFSLVNMVQPGVFDLAKMEQVETRGLSLFMTLPSEAESLPAYEAMVKAARYIADDLGGELRDEQHSTLTPQTIEHNRTRVSEYERKQQLERARH